MIWQRVMRETRQLKPSKKRHAKAYKASLSLMLIRMHQWAKVSFYPVKGPKRNELLPGPLQLAKQSRVIRKEVDGWLSLHPNWSLLYLNFLRPATCLVTKHVIVPNLILLLVLLPNGRNAKEGICVNGVFPGSEDEMLEG